MEINLLDIVDESFRIYAGMTIEDRAIVDARDGLKPAARQCMYAQYIEKITYKNVRGEFSLLTFLALCKN